jgi:RNA polymerase sigma factor (sigma-70 family)
MGAEITDADVLDRCADDPSAFGELYERHGNVVVRYVARRIGGAAAEDLAAEVFVRAFRDRKNCRCEHGSALPWLLGVANHVIADHRRVERRRLESLKRWAAEAPGLVNHEHASLAPELVNALRRLPTKHRDALLLVVWGELSYEEAAIALDVPIGTVRSRVSRARRRLAAALGPDMTSSATELRSEGGANV